MPSTHIYWNLGAFTTPTVLNDTLHLPHANRIIGIDGIQIPTGELISVKSPAASVLDFTSPKQVHLGALNNNCGDGCIGLDNAFILDRPGIDQPSTDLPMLRWSSPDTGIRMSMRTNQGCTQVYSCVFQDGSIPTKSTQRSAGVVKVEKYGCLVIEPQEWIDGINHPEWGQLQRQMFGPETGPLVNWAEYTFDTV
jgi:aldose 1-epimerase